MPTLRIYLNFLFKNDLEEIETNILKNEDNFAKFDDNDMILKSGFFEDQKIFTKIEDTDYYIANYLLQQSKSIPSKNSELIYFKLQESKVDSKEERIFFPILIKIIFNINKKVLCLYSRKVVENDAANSFIKQLEEKYGFSFKFFLTHFAFKKNKLDKFLEALGKLSNFTSICIFDKDNNIIAQNSDTLSETRKIHEFLDEVNIGNWKYVELIHNDLEFRIRISNKKTQNYITLKNRYDNDYKLVKITDYLIEKIKETIDFEKQQQAKLDWFK